MELLAPIPSAQILCLAFLSILFLQSGLDKIFNYRENYEWLKGHFSESPLKNTVGLLAPVITVLETVSGLMSLVGLVMLIAGGYTQIGLIGAQLCALSILSLFFGQRVAQDYEGAATLVGYFLVTIASIYLLGL